MSDHYHDYTEREARAERFEEAREARRRFEPVVAEVRYFYSSGPKTVSADEARACLSGHGARPLSTEYWSATPNAMYRLIPEQ